MIVIDAHVHIHGCFDLDEMFNAARRNFQQAVAGLASGEAVAFLLLTEGAGQHRFREIRDRQDSARRWRALPTLEPDSLRLVDRTCPGLPIFLAAGRQIVTADKLEVLALLSDQEFEEGLPLGRTVEQVRGRGALPALPWGAGKWLGRRKRVLCRYLEQEDISGLFLADNRCRPGLWPFPSFAKRSALKILAGTDPLPFRWEVRRAGSFGSILRLESREIDPGRPAASLRRLLLEPSCEPQSYGQPEAALGFLRNQTAMQIHKHFSA